MNDTQSLTHGQPFKVGAHTCPQCADLFWPATGLANRAARLGAPMYCGRTCAGLARRLKHPPTETERKAAKKTYDAEYRMRDPEARKAYRAAYHQRTYDPARAAVVRKARIRYHVEYCRQPEYKAWKSEYDSGYWAKKAFGEFAEAFRLLKDVEREIAERATKYQIYAANGTLNKAQTRRRSL